MSGITTHVLDVSSGRPAAGIRVMLDHMTDSGWQTLGTEDTDEDGRARALVNESLANGVYRLSFEVGTYFNERNMDSFYQIVTIEFVVKDPSQHYHVPLLLSPFGYSTYRGS